MSMTDDIDFLATLYAADEIAENRAKIEKNWAIIDAGGAPSFNAWLSNIKLEKRNTRLKHWSPFQLSIMLGLRP